MMATVMVVDDSKTVRSYHGYILKAMDIDVIEAENGMEALERSLDGDIDLYLVDVNMPVMDGYSFVLELRKQPNHQLTPVIMVTTQAQEIDKIEAYKVGANLFETKPIKPDQLNAYVNILVQR
jgi:two-component system chemotaxis response regulator CheY